MLETGFVTHSEYQKHIRGEWRTVHDLWRHIRNYMTSYAQPGGFTQGSIVFADATGFLAEDNANLFWDAANHRLGIGTSLPAVDCALHIEFPAVEVVISRLSAKERPWRQWECIDGDWGLAIGIHDDTGKIHLNYDTPIGTRVVSMIVFDGPNARVGIQEDTPAYPLDIGVSTRIQSNLLVTGTTELEGGIQGNLEVTGLLTADGGDFIVGGGDALRVGTSVVNQDVDFHLGLVAVGDWSTYGFYWRYKGTGAGNNNTLQLWAQNQEAADVKVYEIWQDGKITFSPDVTFGNIAIGAEARFYDNGNYVGFEAPALDADQIWVLPSVDGDAGDFLQTGGDGNLVWAAVAGGTDEKVKVDAAAVAGYLGVAGNDGVLQVDATLTYTDGGNFVTLGVDPSAIKLDDLGAPDDNADLDFSTAKHGLVPKGTDVGHFLKDDGTWAAGGGGGAVIFPDLTDTPANYVGAANKIVKVNATPDALEFGADIEDLEDVDTLTGQAGKYAKVKVGDAGIEWAAGGDGAIDYLDNFEDASIHWSWRTHNLDADRTIVEAANKLTIAIAPGTNYNWFDTMNDAPKIFTGIGRPPCEIITKLITITTNNDTRAGIFVASNPIGIGADYAVSVGRRTVGGVEGLNVARLGTGYTAYGGAPYDTLPIWLKIRITADIRYGNHLRFYFSVDGDSWTELADPAGGYSDLLTSDGFVVGLFAHNWSELAVSAEFDFFKVVPSLGADG